MLRPLLTRGYQGYFSVEIFREEYWMQPVGEISRQAKYYLDQLATRLAAP
jgi:sugar phosphate isomerase/epimerase